MIQRRKTGFRLVNLVNLVKLVARYKEYVGGSTGRGGVTSFCKGWGCCSSYGEGGFRRKSVLLGLTHYYSLRP
jgi:hypothetical protein